MTSEPEPVRLVVHGHFYQPPRENPWTEEVPVEPTAAPAHDWNERITAECYRPNGWARVLDEHGQVRSIVDNYEHLSFDVGPTLLSWLERHHPEVLARMVEADRIGGGAIAQAYNHLILPLANERDVRTQVRWGLADFRHRFGRDAAAMWLPETAVNDEVLAVLAEEGVAATILAPNQAVAVRLLDDAGGDWHDVSNGSVAQGVPMRWRHPADPDRGVDVVFYDGALSHDLAFALSGLSSQDLVGRVLASGADGTPVVVATDGETFGHHHKFADRSLAYAFAHVAPEHGVRTIPLAALLEEVPPRYEARVRESAWSCAHGVGRWHADCGCSTGGEPGWNQRWRAPLRAALDLLRDHAAAVFERRGGALLDDPWAVRDAYVAVLLGQAQPGAFVAAHARPGADPVEVLTLLEAQRQALLMYTSCGWFFNDLAGIETVQVLRYAARLVDLLDELGEPVDLAAFEATLDEARSNRPEEGTGRDIWRRDVVPSRVDAERVVSHLALLDLLEQREAADVVGAHRVLAHEHRHRRRGGIVGVAGRVELEHVRTLRRSAHVYAAVRLGGLEVVGAVRPAAEDPTHDDRAFARLVAAADDGQRVTAVLRLIDECFGPREFGLEAALPEAAGEIVASSAAALEDRFGSSIARLWEDNRAVLSSLATAGYTLQPELRAPVEYALGHRLRVALADAADAAEGDRPDDVADAVRAAADAAWEGRRLRVEIGGPRAAGLLAAGVLTCVRRAVAPAADDGGTWTTLARDLLHVRRPLRIDVDLARPQELLVDALESGAGEQLLRLAQLLGVAPDAGGGPGAPGGPDRDAGRGGEEPPPL